MTTILHKADERGKVNFGWLDSKHSFSFGHYHDPAKMNFGALRVLNDDIVTGGGGFGTHPHDNMEIISIPLKGDLEHTDSTGTEAVIRENDVQIMSAGTGIKHSEKNHHSDEAVNFLQIWIMPKKSNIEPRYDQKTFKPSDRINKLLTVVAPDATSAVWINQDAWISLGNYDEGKKDVYPVHKPGNGVYLFVLEGSVKVGDTILSRRDALGIWDISELHFESITNSQVLLIDVPTD